MKIYILRHEDRPRDCSFFVPLTKNGLINSKNLIPFLKKENINIIYSSPYIRTLQTINPYSEESKLKINIEYGLGELQHEKIMTHNGSNIELPEYLQEIFNGNCTYKSIIKLEDIKYPETESDIKFRFRKVLKQIISENYNNNLNILLVTHRTICNNALKLVNKVKKLNLSQDILNNYNLGKITLIYDNEWTYKPIN